MSEHARPFRATVHDPRGRQFLDRIRTVRDDYLEARRRTEQAFAVGDAVAGERLLADELVPRQLEYQRAWVEMVDYQRALLTESIAAAARSEDDLAPARPAPSLLARLDLRRSAARSPRR